MPEQKRTEREQILIIFLAVALAQKIVKKWPAQVFLAANFIQVQQASRGNYCPLHDDALTMPAED